MKITCLPALHSLGDHLVLRGYDERGSLLWGPEAWQSPFPSDVQLQVPLTVTQILVETYQGQLLTGADLIELWEETSQVVDGPVNYPIPPGASASTQDSLGITYFVLDLFWVGFPQAGMISLKGLPLEPEIEISPQSTLGTQGKPPDWTLLLHDWCSSCALLAAPGGGVFLQFTRRPESDELDPCVPTLQVCQVSPEGVVLWHTQLEACSGTPAMGLKEDGSLWLMDDAQYWQFASGPQALLRKPGLLSAEERPLGIRLKNPQGYDLGEDLEEPESPNTLAELGYDLESLCYEGKAAEFLLARSDFDLQRFLDAAVRIRRHVVPLAYLKADLLRLLAEGNLYGVAKQRASELVAALSPWT